MHGAALKMSDGVRPVQTERAKPAGPADADAGRAAAPSFRSRGGEAVRPPKDPGPDGALHTSPLSLLPFRGAPPAREIGGGDLSEAP